MNLFDFIRIFECLISDLSSCRTCSDDPCTDLTRGVRFCHTTDVTSYVECLSPGWCFERLCAPGVAFDRLTLRCNAPMADPEKDPLEDKDDTEGDKKTLVDCLLTLVLVRPYTILSKFQSNKYVIEII